MRIINNKTLKRLFIKGPKHKVNHNISCEGAKGSVAEVLNDCIDTWCNKHDADKSILTKKKYKVVSKVNEKI